MTKLNLLTIDLSMFGEGGAPAGASGAAPAAGESSAPAPAPAEVRYGKQQEQTAAPQTPTPTPETPPDKGKLFKDLIKGEYKDQYAAETQKLINRRFAESDAKIQAQQPIIDLLASRYGITDGDMTKLASALESDTAYWAEAADAAGMTVEQYQQMRKLEAQNAKLLQAQRDQQAQYMARQKYAKWQAEAEQLKGTYPQFNLEEMQGNDLFMLMLRNNYPMEQAFKACSTEFFSAQAAANAEKAVTDNIRARGNRPAEAGSKATPAFQVKDDVSKLSNEDVLNVLKKISNKERISFG